MAEQFPTQLEAEAGLSETGPVRPDEMLEYLKALEWLNQQPNEYVNDATRSSQADALAALSDFAKKRPDADPQSLVATAGFKRENIGRDLSEAGKAALDKTIDQLAESADDPEEVRLAIKAHREGQAVEDALKSLRPDASDTADTLPYYAPPVEVPTEPESSVNPVYETVERPIDEPSTPNTRPEEVLHIPRPEQGEIPAIVQEVIDTAKGTAIINTDLAPGWSIIRYKQTESHAAGFQTFGDGLEGISKDIPSTFYRTPGDYNRVLNPDGSYVTDMVEGVAFTTPPPKKLYKPVDTKVPGGFLRRSKVVTHLEEIGEEPITILNTITGEEEPAVWFDYGFNNIQTSGLNPPKYGEINGGRDGNHFLFRLTVPKSVADRLLLMIQDNPSLARQIAQQTALQLGGMDEESWNTGGVRPPYDDMGPDHRIYLVTPGLDPEGHPALIARKLENAPR